MLYSLVGSCEANEVNPEAYLADVLLRVQTHPASRIEELLPHLWTPQPSQRRATGCALRRNSDGGLEGKVDDDFFARKKSEWERGMYATHGEIEALTRPEIRGPFVACGRPYRMIVELLAGSSLSLTQSGAAAEGNRCQHDTRSAGGQP